MSDVGKILCQICGAETHNVEKHLVTAHGGVTVETYQAMFPDAPLESEGYRKLMKEAAMNKAATPNKVVVTNEVLKDIDETKEYRALNGVFGIPDHVKAARRNRDGGPIPISFFKKAPVGFEDFVPTVDTNYIFPIESLKMVMMGLEDQMNVYLVGHAGTGKSTLIEQACARTNRAMLRVQHTVNTEEAHVLGQYVLKNGQTVWEPGPLQICMKYGITYLADEYDRGMPQVLSLYQPVLEGKPLVTKEAPPEWRIIRPHSDFRFVATGNTNGSGDESGLYPSTALQDFANYERFAIMVEISWMPEEQEVAVIRAQSKCPEDVARKLVAFATAVRTEFAASKISAPVSPRSLINAAKVGVRLHNFYKGIQTAISLRMSRVDREAIEGLAKRHFGVDGHEA